MSATNVKRISQLKNIGNVVPDEYEYTEKLVTVGKDLSTPQCYLKWYDICPSGTAISQKQATESRAFIVAEIEAGRLQIKGEMGFVILHHCGLSLLLLLTTWRNTNEMWEALYINDLTQPNGFELLPGIGNQKGTYCVWELGPVWHERQAWVRYLRSARDEQAKYIYINDRFSGLS